MQRIPSLDGVRAISIMLVVLSHLGWSNNLPYAVPRPYGTLGVRIFFVLSGFLITQLLLREHERTTTISLSNFYIRRAYRILPAAFVYLLVVAIIFWHQVGWYYLAAAALYVANMAAWLPRVLGHLWSLSIEEQFYLLWPFALKKWFRSRTGILIGVFVFAPVFSAVLYALHARGGIASSLPVFADGLAIGCLLAIFAPRLPRIPGYIAILMTAIVFLVPFFPGNTPTRTLFELFVLQPLLQVSIAGLILHVIQAPYRFLNWGPFAWLGQISYSLYLWQQPICFNPSFKLGYPAVLLAIACASLSYYCIEQPMLRLRDKRALQAQSTAPALEQTSSAA